MRYLYTFRKNNGKLTRFGPYENEEEASEAFQRVNGYWPAHLVSIEMYD